MYKLRYRLTNLGLAPHFCHTLIIILPLVQPTHVLIMYYPLILQSFYLFCFISPLENRIPINSLVKPTSIIHIPTTVFRMLEIKERILRVTWRRKPKPPFLEGLLTFEVLPNYVLILIDIIAVPFLFSKFIDTRELAVKRYLLFVIIGGQYLSFIAAARFDSLVKLCKAQKALIIVVKGIELDL